MIWVTILLMTLIIFMSRYIFLAPNLPLKLNNESQKFLSYSSSAVLTAIWAPIVFVHDNNIDLDLDNPYLISALLAATISWKTKNVLVTAVFSMCFFFFLTNL